MSLDEQPPTPRIALKPGWLKNFAMGFLPLPLQVDARIWCWRYRAVKPP